VSVCVCVCVASFSAALHTTRQHFHRATCMCLCMWVSVTRQYCVKTVKPRIMKTTPHDSSGTLGKWSLSLTMHVCANNRQLSVCVAKCFQYPLTPVGWRLHSACCTIWSIFRASASRGPSALAHILVCHYCYYRTQYNSNYLVTYAGDSRAVGRVISWVCDCVCVFVCVSAI